MSSTTSFRSTCSRWLAIAGALSACLQPALAAYVQFQDCIDAIPMPRLANQTHFVPESLRAELRQWNDATEIDLQVWGRFPGVRTCDDAPASALSRLTVASASGTAVYETEAANVTCDPEVYFAARQGVLVGYNIQYSVDRMHPVETFELKVRLQGDDRIPFACLEAPLTPEIGSGVTAVARWVPACVLALVIIAAGLTSLSQLPSSSGFEIDQAGPFFREASRSHLTHVADCLSYIQFIFFSGVLSINYPGFFQPVVSHSSWSTLMTSTGPAAHTSPYYGIKDGIYEVNGTLTGTYGMELMTQVIGAPVTMETWTNVITYTAMVFVILVVIVQVGKRLDQTRDWFAPPPTAEAQAAQALSGIQHTAWTAFRALVSYFLLPLVAWTAYQLDHARVLPYYHTTICSVVLFVLVACYMWAASRSTPRDMGYLILDSSKDSLTLASMSRSQDVLSIAMFGLLFARGAAIGGLQLAGLPQLVFLLTCEIVQLALITLLRTPAALLTISGLTTVARLLVTLLSVLFLPGVAGLELKCIFGYVILALHASILLFGFLCPSLFQIARVAALALSGSASDFSEPRREEPQIYGLRRLRQRPSNASNLVLPTVPYLATMQPTPSPSHHGRFPSASSSPSQSNSTESPVYEDTSRYYRRPRSRISSAELLGSQVFAVSPSIPENPALSAQYEGVGGSSLSSSSEASSADAADAVHWVEAVRVANASVDYSVREVDMYYGRAKQGEGDEEEQRLREPEEPASSASEPASSSSSSSSPNIRRKVSELWKEWTAKPAKGGGEETGFVVIRPPRTVAPGQAPVPAQPREGE
ncbi:uncharacterized protein E0L32_009966 [Thyridium curvatum]|uniref:Uncharacterized protein n=1 Tax=Thyridium curvatum TaxID=1093900 RepID=A0A507AMX9_9PEZI|nr:uncharacterized protein E0L32_009966 [Thyridium curvatum]TPX08627.1 hypothetical protein E0L32_009966 [Thyridium curvatum]